MSYIHIVDAESTKNFAQSILKNEFNVDSSIDPNGIIMGMNPKVIALIYLYKHKHKYRDIRDIYTDTEFIKLIISSLTNKKVTTITNDQFIHINTLLYRYISTIFSDK